MKLHDNLERLQNIRDTFDMEVGQFTRDCVRAYELVGPIRTRSLVVDTDPREREVYILIDGTDVLDSSFNPPIRQLADWRTKINNARYELEEYLAGLP